ncbi:unnamed protein product [Chrysoparadoxa australica]
MGFRLEQDFEYNCVQTKEHDAAAYVTWSRGDVFVVFRGTVITS